MPMLLNRKASITNDVTSPGDVVIESDTDVSGAGDVIVKTGAVERFRITALGIAKSLLAMLLGWEAITDHGAVIDGVTDNRAAILASIAAVVAKGGGNVWLGTGVVGATGAINFPAGVTPRGGGGAKTNPVTTIKALDATLQVSFSGRGGLSADFLIDGNHLAAVATGAFCLGLGAGADQCVQRTFRGINVVRSAGPGRVILGAQNCKLDSCDAEDNAGPGEIVDLGAGNNVEVRCENRNNGSSGTYQLVVQQSGASPAGAFAVPTDNEWIDCIVEQPAVGSLGDVFGGNGRGNTLPNRCADTLNGLAASRSIYTLRRTNGALNSVMWRVIDPRVSGTVPGAGIAGTIVYDVQGAGVQLVLEGYAFHENHLTTFAIDDNATVDLEGLFGDVAGAGGITNVFTNAAGGGKAWYQVLVKRIRNAMVLFAQAVGDQMLAVITAGDAKNRWWVQGNGYNNWTDGGGATAPVTLGYATAAGVAGLALSGCLKIQGQACSLFSGAGAPAIGAANGSIYLRTDGGAGSTIYARVNGAWTAIA